MLVLGGARQREGPPNGKTDRFDSEVCFWRARQDGLAIARRVAALPAARLEPVTPAFGVRGQIDNGSSFRLLYRETHNLRYIFGSGQRLRI